LRSRIRLRREISVKVPSFHFIQTYRSRGFTAERLKQDKKSGAPGWQKLRNLWGDGVGVIEISSNGYTGNFHYFGD
jgi:hypothetical protein